MALTDINLADRSGSLVESHKGYDPRIILFYFIMAALLLTLATGLGYQQLSKTGEHRDAERQQNQRRILVPGPRGNIFDRNHKLLVGNRPRFSVRILLDEVRPEILREYRLIRKNYRALGDADLPTVDQMARIARIAVVQRYLDEVNRIVGRDEKVNGNLLMRHLERELLLPFTLIDDLAPEEYARLIERLPVNSPTQVYTSSTRYYPYGSTASHTLGYVGSSDDLEIEDFPGGDLKTFKMNVKMGRYGIEQRFDSVLQGEAGGAIFRVDPAGNRVNPPIQVIRPKQGRDMTLSLDVELQAAAEAKLAELELAGAAVALDVATGEVLVLASKPDYDLSQFSPRISTATWADANARGALFPRAIQGTYPPGSSFKILMTIAGFRSGVITPESTAFCRGFFKLGREFDCHDRHAHGEIGIEEAIERSCNVFFYEHGYKMGPDVIASEAKRFQFDRPTGIELNNETRRMLIPDPTWKRKDRNQSWVGGDTVLMSIGQGFVAVSPLQMACFSASVARDEVRTQPTLLHQPNRPRQRHERIGLTADQRATLLRGMEQVTAGEHGTARILQNGLRGLPPLTGLRIAAKTGTAQAHTAKGTINFAWLIAFAPVDDPKIALAIAIEGDTPGEETGGGLYASPVAHAILRTWLDQKTQPTPRPIKFKTE